jgi:predicted transposase YbfD/YdcC
MELFGKSTLPWLQTFLALPNGIPSHDTFGRVFARLNPQRFQECFLSWTQAVAHQTHGTRMSLDDTTVRASFDRATASSPFPMLSAWCSHHGGLVMGPMNTDSTSNEITAIPELLPLLAITGCMVTIDALGCPTHIATQLFAQGGDDLCTLKRHHKKAHTAVKPYCHEHVEHHLAGRTTEHFFDAFDDSHGRLVRSADAFVTMSRQHGDIENKLHWS